MDEKILFSQFNQNDEQEYILNLPLSQDYKVYINGVEAKVYTCRISKYPYNRTWPGFQRSIDQTETASFVNIVCNDEIDIRVDVTDRFAKAIIKPYSSGIVPKCDQNTVFMRIKENGQYVLETDDYHHCLYILKSAPVLCKDNEAVYYFGPGIHFPGKITLSSNESVYIDKDAYVFGWIYAQDAENIHVFGNGILDGTGEERVGHRLVHANGNIRFVKCKNVFVEGISLVNSAMWCFSMLECEKIVASDIKIFGQWRYNTDGIDIVNSSHITIKNSLIHSFDDAITIKGLVMHSHKSNRNILIQKCVIWCDWGRACELGIETKCDEYCDIIFKDCDVIRGGCVALEINNGNYADIHDIIFENIRVEYEHFYTAEEFQVSENDSYSKADCFAKTSLIKVVNPDLSKKLRIQKGKYEAEKGNGYIHDVTFKDIAVYYDEMLPRINGKYDLDIIVDSIDDTIKYSNIKIDSIFVNKILLKEEDMLLSGSNIDIVTIK